MKKLVVIRHAESSPGTNEINDFERDLTTQGKKEAAKMAAILLNSTAAPEFITSSPAVRALNTAHIFAATFGFDDVKTDQLIYEASAGTLLQRISFFDDQFSVVYLIGHNPGVSDVLYKLTGKITTMPTSSWVEVDLDIDQWAAISADTGTLIQYQYP